ncbi:MAG TPA: RidA family protein [Candidatus Dormibacteraeota bacterium]|nr:RidA family protein [Candidatus Dormibacteraeota bacterium]
MAEILQREVPSSGPEDFAVFLPPVRHADRVQLRRVGEMLYTPAVIPRWGDELRYVGTVDAEVSVRTAARGARLCVHNILAMLEEELGSLDRVRHVQQLNVLVRCSEGFLNPGRVADGASDALYQAFGERGRHRRSVVETDQLPEGAPVQVSAIFRVDTD